MGLFDIFKSHKDEPDYNDSLPIDSRQTAELPVNYTKSEAIYLAQIQAASCLGQKMCDAWMESKRINANIKALRIQTNAEVQKHAQSMKAAREIIATVYGERAKALNAHYAVLDKAMQSNDRELIIHSLQNISSIVVANPLDQILKCINMLDNPNQKLQLDF